MLNLKSDLGLNYLLKFQDFCALLEERGTCSPANTWLNGGLPVRRALTTTTVSVRDLPSMVSFCTLFSTTKLCSLVASIDLNGMEEPRSVQAVVLSPVASPELWSCILRQPHPRCEPCSSLSQKAAQVAQQRRRASQAPARIWFHVCISA